MLERLQAAGDARAHPRRHRARRAQQLGPHPVLGLRADLDLAATCRSTPAAPSRALAAERGQDPIDTLCDYLVDDKGATRVLVTSISEDDIARHRALAAWRWSAPTAIASRPTAPSSQGMPHPRFYGTFPRIIDHYVRERGVLPLELAIHKMTGATARALKLTDRGLLREGYRADVAIFDPADFRDRATYADPHQYPDRRAHHRDRQRHSWWRTRPTPARCRARCCGAIAPAGSAEPANGASSKCMTFMHLELWLLGRGFSGMQ